MRRYLCGSLTSLALALATIAAASAVHAQTAPPSVVVIVLDDIGRDESLTQIDALASQGMRFTRFYSWPVCSPTRYAAFFGRYPRRDWIGNVIDAFDPGGPQQSPPPPHYLTSLAEVFQPTHITTLIGKWHLGRSGLGGDLNDVASGPFVQGFDNWLAGTPTSIATAATGFFPGYWNWKRVDQGAIGPSSQYATNAQCDAFVGAWAPSVPKFVWLAFNAAHAPYDPVPPGPAGLPGTARADYLQVVNYLNSSALPQVLAAINLATTYVFLFTDNGTENSVRPNLPASRSPDAAFGFHKGSVFEGGVNVPFVVAGPGVPLGTSDRLISAADIPATLLDLFGLEADGFEDSLSFADALGGISSDSERTWVFTERFRSDQDEMAVIEKKWKLRRYDPDGLDGPQGYVDQYYNLLLDPTEQSPLTHNQVPPIPAARLLQELNSVPPRTIP
jgi:arylsulfatase A-like enzyme